MTRLTEALTEYDKAITLDPTYSLAYYAKGYILANLSRYEEALAAIDKAIATTYNQIGIEPAPDAYVFKGGILYSLGRYDEALAALNSATKLDTNNEYTQHINEMKKLIQNKNEMKC